MKKYLKLFVIEIEIDEDQWFVLPKKQPLYKKGQRIMVPIKTSSAYHAEMKFENNYCGSEFPHFHIVNIHKCDNEGLFAPTRFLIGGNVL